MLEIPDFLLNEKYGDRYFDIIDALDEARHIHINGAKFFERLRDGFAIGETGFGAGRLLVAVMEALSDAHFCGTLSFTSVELHPITAARMSHILESFRYRAARHIDKVIATYSSIDTSVRGWHSARIFVDDVCRDKNVAGDVCNDDARRGDENLDDDRAVNNAGSNRAIIELRLFIGEALDMVESMTGCCDAWFLDGHAPAKNPDIWRADLMAAVGRKTAKGGTVTTYTVAGHVRKNLTAAGFEVEKVSGHGRKREALRGEFRGDLPPSPQ